MARRPAIEKEIKGREIRNELTPVYYNKQIRTEGLGKNAGESGKIWLVGGYDHGK